MSFSLIKRMAIFFFCVITMFPAYLNYKKDQPSYDITQIADPAAITVVSANIRGFNQDDKGNTHWFVRAPLLVKTLQKAAPDIIGMEEVSKVQYDYLKKSLCGYNSETLYSDDDAFSGSTPLFFNTAKFDLVQKGGFWVSETPEKMSKGWDAACYRVCVFLVLRQKSDGRTFAVFNTHLDHKGAEARVNGVRMIAERMKAYGDIPCILLGDLNFGAEYGRAYRTATSLFRDAKYCTDDSDDGTTWHGWEITDYVEIDDYFFISKTGINVQQYKILRDSYNGVYPSDHYPIMMKITLTDASPEEDVPQIVPADPIVIPHTPLEPREPVTAPAGVPDALVQTP